MSVDLALVINGTAYRGWKRAEINRSLERMAGSFQLVFSERWAEDMAPIPIYEGDECQIKADGDTMITGYVDSIDLDEGPTQASATATGRSKTGDLVDCSAIYKRGQWRGASLIQIARDLCGDFGITVNSDVDLSEKFRRYSIQEGETVAECLERGARARGVMMTTDDTGNLLFVRGGQGNRSNTVIERGRNIKRSSRKGSWAERHSQYIVKAQEAGDANRHGASASQPKATATDSDLGSRHRPLIILAEEQANTAQLKDRAAWERNVRAGRSSRYTCTVLGWRDEVGDLWAPGVIVRVIDDRADINADLVIASTRQIVDIGGDTTELELTVPHAFAIEPLPQPKGRDLLSL